MEFKKIGVVGAGTMGLGIAQVCAQSGFEVVFNDIKMEIVDKAVNRITKLLSKDVDKGKITAEAKDATLGRIKKSENVEDMADCDVIIEAIVENMDAKKSLYQKLDAICKPEAILATNTSSLSVSELASATKRPAQFIGMHFFNPVQVMKLIEVVTPLQVAQATIDAVMDLGVRLGKEPVPVKDSPGFVVNRILTMGSNEVPFMLHEGVATPDAIDKCMKLGANWRMGPCELNDLVGLDISIAIRETLYAEFKEPKYRPSPFLYQMIRAGFLGRKTGKGWYEYDEDGKIIGINRSVFK
ncbi:MAG: 3-hydroxybutyryl-CoA dehydrogenase [Syntrophomonadaceae bacterium]|nr:3-hydroxybutyryl-CoA dehydrogenase [Syntrophomonadaceae bacterium]